MTKLAYLITAALILALAVFVFRPDTNHHAGEMVKIVTIKPPVDYQLQANGVHQVVVGKTVTIGAIALPLAEEVASGMWNQWSAIAVPTEKVVRGIPASGFAAHDYGIDSSVRRLWGDGFDLSWGSANDSGYIADLLSGSVFVVGAEAIKRLDQLSGRLDSGNPLPPGAAVKSVESGSTRITTGDGGWVAVGASMRPDFRLRVEAIMRLASSIRVADLHGIMPEGAEPIATVRVEVDSQTAAMARLPATYDIRVTRTPNGGALAVNQLPVQRLTTDELAAWQSAIAALAEDRLFNLGDGVSPNPMEGMVVEKNGKPWFRLVSTTAKDMDDFSSRWDVVWDGGREFADPSAAQRLIAQLNDLTVHDVHMTLALEEDWKECVSLMLIGKGIHGSVFLQMRGREVRNATHTGVVTRMGDLLEHLSPDQFLDTMIAGRSPERVMKIQRRFTDRQPAVEEVLVRDSRGGWSRTWPRSEPVDPVAVQRVARVIATSRALNARLATPEDRAIANAPTFEIAVRFGPKPTGKANDFTELEDTTTNDLGLSIRKDADGHWRALAIGTGTAYELDDDVVEQLRQDVANPVVLPLVPALVRRVQLSNGVTTIGLARSGEQWLLAVGDKAVAANAVEVRRLLRDLAALTARRRSAGGALAIQDIALTISLELPGFDRESERLLLQIGKPGAAGAAADEVALFAESTRPGSLEMGRAFTGAAQIAGFVADAARFTVAP